MAYSSFIHTVGCVTILVLAGCIGDADPPKASVSETPSTIDSPSASPTNPPSSTTDAPPPAQTMANFTDCQGSLALLLVPADWVQDDLPPNYNVTRFTAGDTDLRIEMTNCAKISIDGTDRGPASFGIVFAAVDDPFGTPDTSQRSFWFLFGVYTENQALVQWATSLGIQVIDGNLTHTRISAFPEYSEITSAWTDPAGQLYRVHGFPDKYQLPTEDRHRYYYGPNPATDHWDDAKSYSESGAGPGEIEMAERSQLANISNGQTRWPILTVAMESTSRLIIPGLTDET